MLIPKVYAYSINSVVAEKFEAFVSLGLNRVKILSVDKEIKRE